MRVITWSFALSVAGCGTTQDLDGDGVTSSADCNDFDAAVSPGSVELCNGIDDDCDGEVDEGVLLTLFVDADLDTFGDPNQTVQACSATIGLALTGVDCDDTDSSIHPQGDEVCNHLDDDCDGQTDEELDIVTAYADVDGDGFGDPDVAVSDCDYPAGWVTDGRDCDDTDASAWPSAPEQCDGADDDCDGQIDEGLLVTRYVDADGDGYGNPNAIVSVCPGAVGVAETAGDCNDSDVTAYPGAIEVCDGADDDCDGAIDEGVSTPFYLDADGDGFGSGPPIAACTAPADHSENPDDCNDAEPLAFPGGIEVCDHIDNDCDGAIDEGLDTSWWLDGDGDGLGDPLVRVEGCAPPTVEFVANRDDCDDGDAAVPPNCTASLWGNWPTAGRNPTRDGAVPGFVGEVAPILLWDVDLDGERYEPFAIANGQLFVTIGYYFDTVMAVVALDLATGAEVWRYDAGSDPFSLSGVTWADGLACMTECYGSRGDLVVCFDAVTGHEAWSETIGMQFEIYMPPLAMDGVLYSGGGTYGGLYGHDLTTGTELFYEDLPQSDDWGAAGFDNTVYTWVDEDFIAHDPLTGDALWEVPYGGWLQNQAMPAISEDGVAYVIGDSEIRAISLNTGSELWSRSESLTTTAAVGGGWVYATQSAGDVKQFSAEDGSPGLTFPGDGDLQSQPVLTLDALIVASEDNTYVYDLETGTERFRIPYGGTVAVSDNTLVIVDSGGHVRTFGW